MLKTGTEIVSNLNADLLDGFHGSDFVRAWSGPTSGSASATFQTNNKPGGSSANSWLPVTVGGAIYYIPLWS